MRIPRFVPIVLALFAVAAVGLRANTERSLGRLTAGSWGLQPSLR